MKQSLAVHRSPKKGFTKKRWVGSYHHSTGGSLTLPLSSSSSTNHESVVTDLLLYLEKYIATRIHKTLVELVHTFDKVDPKNSSKHVGGTAGRFIIHQFT